LTQQKLFYQYLKKKKLKFEQKKSFQASNAVMLCSIVGHYDQFIKFESYDRYHCIQKTILNGDDLLALIHFLMGGEKGSLCFNELNTPKLNLV